MPTATPSITRASRRAWFDAVSAVRSDLVSLADRLALRLQLDVSSYRDLPFETIAAVIRENGDALLTVLLHERSFLSDDEREFFLHRGTVRAGQGIADVDLIRAWFLCVNELTGRLFASARNHGVPDGELVERMVPVSTVSEMASEAVMEGHRRADRDRNQTERSRRTAFVEQLVLGTIGPVDLAHAADEWRLDPEPPYIAFRCHLGGPVEVADVEDHLEAGRLSGGRRTGLSATIDGELCGFVSRVPTGAVPYGIGFGHPARLGELASSFRTAGRALATATAFCRTGAQVFDRLGVRPALIADVEVSDGLVRRWVEPVLRDGRSGLMILATVESYLAHGMRNDATAAAVFIHHNTLRYRLDRFEQLSGADLHSIDTLIEVWWALQAWRLRRTNPDESSPT